MLGFVPLIPKSPNATNNAKAVSNVLDPGITSVFLGTFKEGFYV